MKALFLSIGVAAAVSALPAAAATLDFSGLFLIEDSPLVLPNATITNAGLGRIQVGASAAGQTDGFCFLGFGCAAGGTIAFTTAVSNLAFDVDAWNTGDAVSITAFLGATNKGTLNATANGRLDFAPFGAIDRLVFVDNSDGSGGGVGYSTFSFTTGGDVNVIPLPAAMPLLAAGLLALGMMRRRRGA